MTRTETIGDGRAGTPWWGELNRSHRWILLAAMLGWLFDAMDQRIFVVARTPALQGLLKGIEPSELPTYAGWATGLFIAGWATGGLVFGLLGDRYGRVRTMTWTIVLYSVFTALSGLARSWPEFAAYRFLCGMGIGGEYAAGVALVAEAMPARARAVALGVVQASSSIGAIIGSGLSLLVGPQGTTGGMDGWRLLFLFGALPSLMVILIRLRVPEPDRWLRARDRAREEAAEGASARSELRLGDLRAIFRDPVLRRRTLVGMTLGMVGQIGLWSIGLFTPELVRGGLLAERRLALNAAAAAPADPPPRDLDALARRSTSTPEEAATLSASWKREDDRLVGWGTMLQDVGSFLGAPLCTFIAVRFGRRKSFALAYAMAMASVWIVFGTLSRGADVYWMLPLLGFCMCGIFGVIIVYLPELYPTRLRTTGTGFCYNIARYVTATGPLVLGKLTLLFTSLGYATPIRPAALCLSFIYVLGLLIVPFAPETRGQPLPE